ncbi:hypothetical protein FW778_21330 [Ginsengibacter hankyongi]|uniref:Fibronectin type-III domain-containing protein n=1 Tax=Ginsengibacter hankyongi TaxID=2607284 RepID=A0A5J5IC66_9BACT|nr:hypothetical protein [Ginsengibacter hankyongi]KAA9035504.1 hypothetical protein FW778_21330 [Ginsengibacter hankyongi]
MVIKIQSAKIKTGLSGFSNTALSPFANTINTALTANDNFPLTQALLPNLSSALTGFNTALANAENRDKAMISLRDTARTELVLQLTDVASSVTYEAKGDRDKLLTSGFELYKDSSASPLGSVTGFKLLDAEVGIGLTLVCDGVKYRVSYTHQITADPLTTDSVWTSFSTTSKEYTFANLPAGTKFWARIIAVGTKEQVAYSDPLSRITQLNIN